MVISRATGHHARPPSRWNTLVALGLVGTAVICQAALQRSAPGVGPYLLTLPAVAAAGIFCGTLPASAAALAAGIATCWLILQPSVFALPVFNTAQIDTVLFVPACAGIIWATHRLRQTAGSAALAEARLAEVFRQVPAAAAILESPDGRLLLNSRASRDILGHAPLGEMAAYGGVHPDGRRFEPDDYPIIRALRTGEVVGGVHMRYRRPDGSVVDLDVHAGPVWGHDGRIVAAVGMAFDITDRMAAERRLHESETRYRTAAERLRAAIDAGGLGIWELDLVTRSIQMDATMATMLGMDPVEVVLSEAEFRAFIHPDDYEPVRARMEAAIAAGGAYGEECRMVTTKGDVRWIVSRGAVMQDMRKAIGVLRDETERREREESLRAALEARDVLMREADHRIKNSLQLVASLLSIQLSKAEDGAAKEALGSAIARVRAIANAHLALERSTDFRMIDVDTMVSELCARVGELNPAVEIRCLGASGASLDAEQAIPLGLITSELLTNALRHGFSPGEPGEVSLTIGRDDRSISLVVADCGKGFTVGARRLGLGSSVIAALSKQIKASISTESSPGHGTVVTIRLDVPPAGLAGNACSNA